MGLDTLPMRVDQGAGGTSSWQTDPHGVVASNSTIVPLGANATFTGAWMDTEQVAAIALTVSADQVSAANGLKVQYSDNGATVRRELQFLYDSPNSGRGFQLPAEAKYARVSYTNGPIAQGMFAIQTKLASVALQVPEVAIVSPLTDSVTAALSRSVITGKRPDTTYGNLGLTAANELKTADQTSLVPMAYDEIVLSYTGSNLTGVVYKASSVVVATLTLGYTGQNLTSVVRT